MSRSHPTVQCMFTAIFALSNAVGSWPKALSVGSKAHSIGPKALSVGSKPHSIGLKAHQIPRRGWNEGCVSTAHSSVQNE